MANNHTNNTAGTRTMVGLGAGAIAIAAASYYFLGPQGKKHKAQLKGWMIRAKGEIIEKLEEAKEVTEPVYHSIVDSVITPYMEKGNIDRNDITEFAQNLKNNWKQIVRSGSPKKKKPAAKKTAKTATKKNRR